MSLAAIGVDGSLTGWDPGSGGSIFTLIVSDNENTVYVGGAFNSMNDEPRANFAVIKTEVYCRKSCESGGKWSSKAEEYKGCKFHSDKKHKPSDGKYWTEESDHKC